MILSHGGQAPKPFFDLLHGMSHHEMCSHDTKTSQELRMLSTVTLNCKVKKIVVIQVLNCQLVLVHLAGGSGYGGCHQLSQNIWFYRFTVVLQ